ncbi:hypothetical protein GEMRC1_005842 [Eukaryota sp. GEM-RC1]
MVSSNFVIPSLDSFPSLIVKLTLSILKSILLDSANVLLKGAQEKRTRIFFSDRAETLTSSLPSNLLSEHNACQLPFSSRFLSLIPSCLTDNSSNCNSCSRHRTFRHDEIKNLIAEHTSFAVDFKLKLNV